MSLSLKLHAGVLLLVCAVLVFFLQGCGVTVEALDKMIMANLSCKKCDCGQRELQASGKTLKKRETEIEK